TWIKASCIGINAQGIVELLAGFVTPPQVPQGLHQSQLNWGNRWIDIHSLLIMDGSFSETAGAGQSTAKIVMKEERPRSTGQGRLKEANCFGRFAELK